MKNIIILSNCQGDGYKYFLNYYLKNKYNIIYKNIIDDLTKKNDNIDQLILNSDIIIKQHFYSDQFYYNDKKIIEILSKSNKKIPIIYIHSLYFKGYFIDNETNKNTIKSIKSIKNIKTINYSNKCLLITPYLEHLITNNYNNDDIIQELNTYFRKDDILRNLNDSLEELKKRENGNDNYEKIDVKICDFIETNYKKKQLFHTLNHPSNYLLNYYSYQIFLYLQKLCDIENMDFNESYSYSIYEFVGSSQIPIYNIVKDTLELEFDITITKVKNNPYTLDQYIEYIKC